MTMMSWQNLLNANRLGSRKPHDETARSPFHKDYDRIVFSGGFRRLNRKTQVHPLAQHDAVHTRLTHSLEVSCVGRSLGMLAAEKIINELPHWVSPADVGAIIQAACLAHDIGNPPFGHAGEYAIRDWFLLPQQAQLMALLPPAQFADLCQFEGNAQGFRILSQLEYHPNEGGMRLTYATLGAYFKYPWLSQPIAGGVASHKRAKFGCYQTEKLLLQQVAQQLGLIQQGDFRWCRHPLAYLLEAADDICYTLIDLEDGLALGMLRYEEVEPLFLQLLDDLPPPPELKQDVPDLQKIAALRGKAIEKLVNAVANAFAEQQEALLTGQLKGSLLNYCKASLSEGIDLAKDLARQRIFNHPQKAQLELAAYASLHTLLSAFAEMSISVYKQQALSFKQQRLQQLVANYRLAENENLYLSLMQMLDFIASLSDHHALSLAQSLQGIQP
ncbi:MAG TPA: deoxyguanosinetriphosphate triphosphohydrolase [Agitococcus sp.]|nr:deoxyguanosinetriphosphate triphosphohydrolase [Agitococcus sp.]HNL35543.1 deoxyguanosinetriphosphate triphosphohydrolase [Agitococcus sp.]